MSAMTVSLDASALQNTYFALRHGQSLANVQGIIASDPAIATEDYGLTTTGHEQALAAAADIQTAFQQGTFDQVAILSSDLLRARQTAAHVLATLQDARIPVYQAQVVLEPRLRERHFGALDRQSDALYHTVWEQDAAANANHTQFDVESVQAVVARTTAAICEYDAKMNQALVVLVAHGDVLQITQTAFLQVDARQHRSLPHLETATLRRLSP